ncbi:hypothetical protein [Brevibacillus centrosporus]|uniref:hypothetical protein n=1 Tax=Brevibacillus centrosporus TaxID=54910 RepID=UPI000F09C41C|nr:hypothetical protein [Brevibacillus centrosporus]MEC2131046.1 hypothetical protein [Brevibacillus centrosporus]MED4907445.1 hypothetical protein [Brevibacillus centrosporus]RNB72904.1 hypothetical protein EDM55_03420 [Brevibacillus centrosporus]GED32343.1 hypothetical protein BCE02nite_34840 [Brevibacillus centrosporus]
MIASEIIGLTALVLVLIFFYTRKLFHKLRSLFILVLAFASAGLVGYSSASSIGIGWTVSLALFIFLGVAVTVIYLHRREDRQIEEHFELALKSEQPLSLGSIDAIPSELTTASAPLPFTPEPKLLEIHPALPPIEEIGVENGEKEPMPEPRESPVAVETVAKKVTAATEVLVDEAELDVQEELNLEKELSLEIDAPVIPVEITEPEAPSSDAAEVELVPETTSVIDDSVQTSPETPSETIAEPESSSVGLESFEASNDSAKLESTGVPAEKVNSLSSPSAGNISVVPVDRERIQTLSENAEKALQRGDFLRAYQFLREALSFAAPPTAAYILSRQLVQVLNEMGLYQESISVMEKTLREYPSLSAKKRDEFSAQITYLEALIHQLQLENKRNLSWSSVPPAIHQKVLMHYRSLFPSKCENTPAIPFH